MAAVMEGPLSKWTNVMKGWQYRWFVLDRQSGILSYYTSKDKMVKGARRGCVRLKEAIIGIDDEDDSTFTITVDHKTFHFQARDNDERERWINALERVIEELHTAAEGSRFVPISSEQFEHKLMETDAYLQLLIDQNEALDKRITACSDVATKEKYSVIKVQADALIEAIKHAIVMLQISKESLKEPVLLNGSLHEIPPLTETANFNHFRVSSSMIIPPSLESTADMYGSLPGSLGLASPHTENSSVPEMSYSSSEDEEFYDAEDQKTPKASPYKRDTPSSPTIVEEETVNVILEEQDVLPITPPVIAATNDVVVLPITPPVIADTNDVVVLPITSPVIEATDSVADELYDLQDEEDLGSMEQHGSVIGHLLSQVRIGMDLTKVVLPTFILERRSLLEMYADFFAHPDLFCRIADMPTPRERMVQVVRWYLSAFHAGRPSEIAKKPYNPILGETFQCLWTLPDFPACSETVDGGPIPWGTKENLCFVAEQVSHHPPISAFYAEHYNKKIVMDGYIWTKSKFLGLSIGVHMIGQAVISVLKYEEEYTLTFPNGYGRSILTTPWVELGGKVHICCAKTGYNAFVEFHTKPFYGGKKHRVTANIFDPNEKKPFVNIEGEWNGIMYAKYTTGKNEPFVDTKQIAIHKKMVKPIDQQGEFESRRLWKDVTYNLKNKNVDEATEHKHALEQRQREEAKERKDSGKLWQTKFFHEEGEHWVYDKPLLKRLH